MPEQVDDERPDPDDLLSLVEYEERSNKKGKLIIYLGYAAGVGKTYTMLYEGLSARTEGRDIVTGYIETHKRPETDTLADRYESIPLWTTYYQGISLKEPDVDKIIERNPEIVLIDELAHTNAPGTRHTYRYQDIEDILQVGISVWTTLNIQHIESLNDKVSQLTRVLIRETVPDTFVQKADEVRVVDISPEGLLKRLKEGKVYIGDLAREAINHFFSRENLLTLRQFALRYVAEYVDVSIMRLVKSKSLSESWSAIDRILVAVRPGPNAENLVRAGYRLAARLDAEWTVMSIVEEQDYSHSSQEDKWLKAPLDTARRLGATIVRYRGNDVVAEIIRYARRNHITTMLMGKPKGINILFSPVYRIIRKSAGIDLILYDAKDTDKPISIKRQLTVKIREEYIAGAILVGDVTWVNYLLTGKISPENQLIIQFIPVVITGLFFRRDVTIVVAITSILLFDFTLVKPYYSLAITDWEYFISFIGYVIIALIISTLATRLRHMVPQIWQSEARVAAVGNLSQILADVTDTQELYESLVDHISHIGRGRFAILTPGINKMEIRAKKGELVLSEKEASIAWWVYEHGDCAGRSTDTLAGGDGYYLPMKGNKRVYGVIGFWFDNPDEMLTADNKEIYDSIASIGVLALDRVMR